ncbi:MAG: NAD(P)H-dependent glycerol-3-phosphate dehydrogenase [candidate division Zixibacteria bacterium]|nr:NAD(P)H-dependent glycerol-3-phosphate dehydrogenase [candidate division Zixibacteria bacterium]
MRTKACILGAGSWGMAIAYLLSKNGHEVTLWEFNQDEYEKLLSHRTIPKKLTDFKLQDDIEITNNLDYAISDSEIIILAVPSQSLRQVLKQIKSYPPQAGFVNVSKGVEVKTLKRMSEVISEEFTSTPTKIATLSGPSHAEEVIRNLPTTVVVAGSHNEFISLIQEAFSNQYFRVYNSEDLVGVELGGALKNIIAIGSGIADGLGMGDNTRGALMTRGLAEITRLGISMGADSATFAGLSGIGDLITTCSSKHSRNRFVGEKLGQGLKLKEILESMAMVAEGVQTTKSGYELAQINNIEMPITTEVYNILFKEKSPQVAIEELMLRKLKSEVW